MRTVSALDVRRHFGELLDEAAAGERLIIERAGQPVAALVPLTDVPELNQEEGIRRRKEAIAEIARQARERPINLQEDSAALIRRIRQERTDQIMRAVQSYEANSRAEDKQ